MSALVLSDSDHRPPPFCARHNTYFTRPKALRISGQVIRPPLRCHQCVAEARAKVRREIAAGTRDKCSRHRKLFAPVTMVEFVP
jgi:hypothetical protein